PGAAAPASHGSRLPSDARWIFASSSISGGSLGFMEYAAHLSGSSPPGEGPDWIGRVLGGDYVAPSVAWQLFVELPRSFVLFDHAQDRAAVLEQAWERAWGPAPGLR